MTIHEVVSLAPASEAVIGQRIDAPTSTERCDEYALSIGGWVLTRNVPAIAVEVLSMGRTVAASPVRLVRPGVVALYPERSDPCGYWLRIGVLGLPPSFRLTLRAVLSDGSTVPLGHLTGCHEPVASSTSPRLAPLMVTSLGRMGTTWLMRLLSEHPSVVVHREYPYEVMACRYWMHQLRVLSAPFDRDSSPHPDSLGSDAWRIGANPAYGPLLARAPSLCRWLGRTHVEALATFCQTSVDNFYTLVTQEESQPDAHYFAEKSLPDQLPILTWELYPHAKEVFLVRDARDALCSMLAFNAKRGYDSFGRGLVTSDRAFVRRVASDMAVLAAARSSRADHTHLLRYEDLIASPELALAGLLEYVGLESGGSTVRGMIERASAETKELVAHRTSDEPGRSIGRWRRDIPPELREECETAFASVLAEFGYGTPE